MLWAFYKNQLFEYRNRNHRPFFCLFLTKTISQVSKTRGWKGLLYLYIHKFFQGYFWTRKDQEVCYGNPLMPERAPHFSRTFSEGTDYIHQEDWRQGSIQHMLNIRGKQLQNDKPMLNKRHVPHAAEAVAWPHLAQWSGLVSGKISRQNV